MNEQKRCFFGSIYLGERCACGWEKTMENELPSGYLHDGAIKLYVRNIYQDPDDMTCYGCTRKQDGRDCTFLVYHKTNDVQPQGEEWSETMKKYLQCALVKKERGGILTCIGHKEVENIPPPLSQQRKNKKQKEEFDYDSDHCPFCNQKLHESEDTINAQHISKCEQEFRMNPTMEAPKTTRKKKRVIFIVKKDEEEEENEIEILKKLLLQKDQEIAELTSLLSDEQLEKLLMRKQLKRKREEDDDDDDLNAVRVCKDCGVEKGIDVFKKSGTKRGICYECLLKANRERNRMRRQQKDQHVVHNASMSTNMHK